MRLVANLRSRSCPPSPGAVIYHICDVAARAGHSGHDRGRSRRTRVYSWCLSTRCSRARLFVELFCMPSNTDNDGSGATKPDVPDTEKIEKLGRSVAAFFSNAVDVLVKPRRHARRTNLELNGALFVFAILSITASTTLFALTFEGQRIAPLVSVCLVALPGWAAFGACAFLVCRVLGGRAPLKETIALVLELLSVVTLLAVFSGYLVSVFFPRSFGDAGLPQMTMFLVELLLSLAYFPLALGALNNLGFLRSCIAGGILAVSYCVINAIMVVLLYKSGRPVVPLIACTIACLSG